MKPHHKKDPAAKLRLAITLAVILLFAPAFQLSGFAPWKLFESGTLNHLFIFLGSFFPPAHSADFLHEMGLATIQTLAMATTGSLLAMLIGFPAALLSTQALSIPLLTAGRKRAARWLGVPLLRSILLLLRGIPEIVWALLFVRAFGLGSTAAVLALGLAYGGMLGKVYSEILESQPKEAATALAASGASRWQIFSHALLPQALPELLSYSVYRWECAIRASAVMGFVGAGGLGQLLDTSIKMMNGGEVGSLLIVFLLLVTGTEAISQAARKALEQSTGKLFLVAASMVAFSMYWLWSDWQQAFSTSNQLFTYLYDFFPADFSAAHIALVAKGTLETLAISAVGTLLALFGGGLLALPAAGRWGKMPKAIARLWLNLLRGVPDLLWAAIMVLAVGLGPFAGTLALALHTCGVLGRLFTETLENADPQPFNALICSGSSRLNAFCYALMPQVAAQWVAYTLYRWENNIRMATVLGLVGAGGLGQQLYFTLSLFQQQQAATIIIAMLGLSWLVEQLSLLLCKRLG
ncbi:phosphonate ABC transporter, permease protein PhnE [Iodobacter ciconiae]|uniref:Phosphonate ABC transporter, permease protein PhnE n=1 Tax=Iodobacter ciconiae TaxID=2496266 RepID=A0A3S8ZTI0_9NEIS|nr:phosphonate ABC transporter, permease protein PhnE [Iodobacter ciconiae]AZN36788.1 phosphonate ABC transporter, permease protein PhnE [Iodobacter ciconiae]